MSCADTPTARGNLGSLKNELIARAFALAPKLAPVSMPCHGRRDSPSSCMAFSDRTRRKCSCLWGMSHNL